MVRTETDNVPDPKLPDSMVSADEISWIPFLLDRGQTGTVSSDPPPVRPDGFRVTAADLVIEDLAAGEAAARARVAELETESDWLKETIRGAVSQLHTATVQGQRHATRVHALLHDLRLTRDETRTLRAQLRALSA
jgi:hypothetical protein